MKKTAQNIRSIIKNSKFNSAFIKLLYQDIIEVPIKYWTAPPSDSATTVRSSDGTVQHLIEGSIVKKRNKGRKETFMATLGVNIDHIATLRQARGGREPDPIHAAVLAELAGARGITAHLREDRRHIQDRDVYILKQTVSTHLNLEMASTAEMIKIAVDVLPFMVTLVPEKREERTTEEGLAVRERERELAKTIATLRENHILVSLFVNPDIAEIRAAAKIGATHIELYTGTYSKAANASTANDELETLKVCAIAAHKLGLVINAGHGLNYQNVSPVAHIDNMGELNIGHSIIARASLAGMESAVREMVSLIG